MSATGRDWFYVTDDMQRGPVDRNQVSGLMSAGVVTGDTFVWSEGMADWTPIRETELQDRPIKPPPRPFQSRAAASPATTIATAKLRRGNRIIALGCAACSYGFITTMVGPLIIVLKQGMTIEQAALLNQNEIYISISSLFLLTGTILFLLWSYRTTKNIAMLFGNQNVTPAGSVYWYFVPVWNFWKPLSAMQNMVRHFGSEKSSPRFVHFWWGAFWVSNIVENTVLVGYSLVEGQGGHFTAQQNVAAFVLVNVLNAVPYYAGLRLVLDISKGEKLAMKARSSLRT